MLFQGKNEKIEYFEGWYYKQVSEDERTAISFIPGISHGSGDAHSFVQYIFVDSDENGVKTVKTGYCRYSAEDFSFSDDPFMIRVGENVFTEKNVSVKLTDRNISIEGKLNLGAFTSIKTSILNPSIMGYYAYIPKMECYHGIVSMNHKVNGLLTINGENIGFKDGKGYIE